MVLTLVSIWVLGNYWGGGGEKDWKIDLYMVKQYTSFKMIQHPPSKKMIKNIQARERKSNIIKLKLQDKKKG